MIFVVGLALLALIGVPVFAVLGAAAAISSSDTPAGAWAVPAIDRFDARLAYDAGLAAIPLFAFAGSVLGHSGAPRRLWRLAQAWLGWLPGGRAVAALPAAALVAAFTGGPGTRATTSRLLLPALVGAGYPERFAGGAVTAGGAIGLLLAPSLALLLYGPVAGLFMHKAVVAGIGPGLLALGLLCVYAALAGARRPVAGQPFEAREALASLRESAWELGLVVLVIAPVAAGLLRLHEAAALAVLYVLAVGVLVHRDVDPQRDLPRLVAESAARAGAVLVVLAIALGLFVSALQGHVLMELMSWVQARIHSALVFLLIVNALLLLVGMAIDTFTAIALVVPVIARLAAAYGIDRHHLAVVVLLNLAIGCLTRPIAHGVLFGPPRGVFRTDARDRDAPWIAVLLLALLAVTCLPAVATWLPDRIAVR